MTVAIAVKVFDGIVLAADSATTMTLPNGSHQVYNHANKVFHLHRDHPIGAMTWGLGNIGSASISSIAKDFRRRLMGNAPGLEAWALAEPYTIEEVALQLTDMVFDELYQPTFSGQPHQPVLGLMVAGYSSGASQAEAWCIEVTDCSAKPSPVQVIGVDQSGWKAFAQADAVTRLFRGIDTQALALIEPLVDAAARPVFNGVIGSANRQPAQPAMPFTDAINLAHFMVDVTVGYNRYLLGPDTVGGQVELAGITRHEGFRWVARKHYYPSDLNPGRPHDHDQ